MLCTCCVDRDIIRCSDPLMEVLVQRDHDDDGIQAERNEGSNESCVG